MEKADDIVGQKQGVFELLIDSDQFWNRLQEDIAAAEKNIYIQTLSFEGDSVGLKLAEAVKASPASDKKIVVDYYTRYILSDKFLLSPRNWLDSDLKNEAEATDRMIKDLTANGVGVRFVNPVGPLFCKMPARNHKKILVIDDRISYIGGINFSDHNFAWHDLMLRIDDPDIAAFLRDDFLISWEGKHFGDHKNFGDIELYAFDGKTNKRAFEPLLDLIDGAEKSIYVQSPYLCHPFADHMRKAATRGVRVTVVSPLNNNKKPLGGYIRYEAARSGFDLWLYEPGMTHLKAMLIDEKYLIIGSCNFDYFSYRFEQETVAVITDQQIIKTFIDNVICFDSSCCRKVEKPKKTISGFLYNLEIRAVGWLVGLFNRG